jgi:hypothetical protein
MDVSVATVIRHLEGLHHHGCLSNIMDHVSTWKAIFRLREDDAGKAVVRFLVTKAALEPWLAESDGRKKIKVKQGFVDLANELRDGW